MCMHYLAFLVSSEVSTYLDKIIESVSLRSIQVHQITSEPKRYKWYGLFLLGATTKIAFSDDPFFFSLKNIPGKVYQKYTMLWQTKKNSILPAWFSESYTREIYHVNSSDPNTYECQIIDLTQLIDKFSNTETF